MYPKVHIFILCFNESVLLPHTVRHYKTMLPHCKITLYDNESTDDSVAIAKSLGCKVISWSSNNSIDDYKYREIKNKCWKHVKDGWVIMCDMDEWICVTEKDLKREYENGTTLLTLEGYNMVGKSKKANLSDIDLHNLKEGAVHIGESNTLCFLRPAIKEMNYNTGAHQSDPIGRVQYSMRSYTNKHMSHLGLPYLQTKMVNPYKRSSTMRKKGFAVHYTDNMKKIRNDYNQTRKRRIQTKCAKKLDSSMAGFIILRHVNSKETDQYWQECYTCIRKYYPENEIVIIDATSDKKFLSEKALYKTTVVDSEFPERGFVLPYYYFSKHAWFKTAVILHDSVFINAHLDFNVETYRSIWDFEHTWDKPTDELQLINALSNHKDVLDVYTKKHMWKGCFGAMSIITHECVKNLDTKYGFSNLLDLITTREMRMAFERVIACMLYTVYPYPSVLGDIHRYCRWGYSFKEYLSKPKKRLPLIKVWKGR